MDDGLRLHRSLQQAVALAEQSVTVDGPALRKLTEDHRKVHARFMANCKLVRQLQARDKSNSHYNRHDISNSTTQEQMQQQEQQIV